MGERRQLSAEIFGRLAARLAERPEGRLAVAVELARRQADPVYLVGGAVRDLALTGDVRDLDLVVDGPCLPLARAVAERLGGTLRQRPEFLTAGVVDPVGEEIDFASARRERYPRPASLPRVEPATLGEDLERRDFTVNALAVRLAPGPDFDLLDPSGGAEDLAQRRLRALHRRSFVDDPTRALRGARLEDRLGFRLEAATEDWIGEAVRGGAFERLSGARWRRELELLLHPAGRARDRLRRLSGLGVLGALAPGLHLDREALRQLDRLTQARRELGEGARLLSATERRGERPDRPADGLGWLLPLALVAWRSGPETTAALAARLDLTRRGERLLSTGRERVGRTVDRLSAGELEPHEIDRVLRGLSPQEVPIAASLAGARGRERIFRWHREARTLELAIDGSDLVAHGARPGPAIGSALAATRDARLDGRLTAAGELAFALEQLGAHGATSAAAGERPAPGCAARFPESAQRLEDESGAREPSSAGNPGSREAVPAERSPVR